MSDSDNVRRCAALYRVSTMKQVSRLGEEESVPLQREFIRRFLAQNHPDWKMVREYSEEGVSGFHNSVAQRNVLQQVLRDAERHEFDVLLLFKADRLSRQALDYAALLGQFDRFGVQVISVSDGPGGRPLDTSTQASKLVRMIEGWQAETESVNTSIRVSIAMEQMARKGHWTGGTPPYGYRPSPGKNSPVPIEIDPEEANVIQKMFGWYLDEELGTVRIAARLNQEGFRARSGKQWSDWSVRRMMKNPILSGHLAYGRTKRNMAGNKVALRRDEQHQMILGPLNADLVIIPEERWRAAMTRMGAYNRPHKQVPHYNKASVGQLLFTGFARCAHCGGPLVSVKVKSWNNTKSGRKVYYRWAYACLNKVSRGAHTCEGQRTYAQRKVESQILPRILEAIAEKTERDGVVSKAREMREQALFQDRLKVERLERKREGLLRTHEAWLGRLDHFFDTGESPYSEDTMAQKVRDIELELKTVEAAIRECRDMETDANAELQAMERFLRETAGWWKDFLKSPRDLQKTLLRRAVRCIVIGKQGFEVHFLFAAENKFLYEWTYQGTWDARNQLG